MTRERMMWRKKGGRRMIDRGEERSRNAEQEVGREAEKKGGSRKIEEYKHVERTRFCDFHKMNT